MNSIGDDARPAPAAPDHEALLAGALSSISDAFKHPQLSCDPSVGGDRPKLVDAVETFRRDVLTNVHAVLPHHSPSEQRRISEGIAQLAERLVGVLLLTGSGPTAHQLIGETLGCLPTGNYLDELTAASKDPDAYAKLSLARWYWLQGFARKARSLAETVHRKTKEPTLEAAARRVILDPQPIKSAPPLFTLNGFGLKLYGRGDRRPDGFYASTLYLCGLFIPLLPISRYLVRDAGEGGWHFLGKIPLSQPQRWYRRALVLAIVGFIGWGRAEAWYESPARLAANDIERVQEKVAAGLPPEKALAEWDRVVGRWDGNAPGEALAPAVEEWAVLKLKAQVKEPFTRAQLPALERTVTRFTQLSPQARAPAANLAVSTKLVAWAQQLGSSERQDLEARLKLLELAMLVGPKNADTRADAIATRHLIATLLSASWPMRAVEQYALCGSSDVEGLTLGAALLDALEDTGTLYADEQASVVAWIASASAVPSLNDTRARVQRRLNEAKALMSAPGRAELLAAKDEKQLAAAIAKTPGDQGLTVALAKALRERGDTAGAAKRLEKLGAPGRMIGDAQLLSAFLLLDAGKVDEAEARLSDFVQSRRSRFIAARTNLEHREKSLQDQLVARAKAGNLPAELEVKLRGQNDQKQGELFREWLGDELAKDAQLAGFAAEYRALGGVVEASLALGTLQLQRAGHAAGEERAALLDDAEQTFLAVNVEAEGSPDYQLGLGQVFHRLGKTKEGDDQLMGLAKRSDAAMKIRVAATYRVLGLLTQARELLQPIYDSGTQPAADEAASLMATMSTSLDDTEKWLSRIKNQTPENRAKLSEMKGWRLIENGKLAEADAEFEKSQAFHAKTASVSSASANNAAVDSLYRFHATGDVAHLDKAISYYQSARQQLRDNPIILGNTVATLLSRMSVGLIDKWVSVKRLKLTSGEAELLLTVLFHGPLGAEVKKGIEGSASYREALSLAQQQQVLAPNDPSSYDDTLSWMYLVEDERGLSDLEERLVRVKKLDVARMEDRLAQARSGSQVEQRKNATSSRLKALEALLPTLSSNTERGVIEYLRCRSIDELGGLELSRERYEQAAAACRRAGELWPALAVQPAVVERLMHVGLMEAASRSEKLKARFGEEQWKSQLLFTAWSLAQKDPEVAAALASSKELQEANRLGLALEPKQQDADVWAVAMLMKEPANAKKVAQSLQLEKLERWVSIMERLAPEEPSVTGQKTLLAAVRAAR